MDGDGRRDSELDGEIGGGEIDGAAGDGEIDGAAGDGAGVAATYDHTQTATHAIVALAAVSAAFLISVQVSTGDLDVVLLMAVFLSIAGVIMFAFNQLRVTVVDEEVVARFRWGWPERRYPLAEVHRADVVRNKWWYGFGIRLTPHGWMYSVWGLDAVQLNFHDGEAFRIGTDEPELLAAALGRDTDG